MTLAAWFHQLDPIAVHLGPLAVRWYGLAYLAGFVVAYLTMRALAKRGLASIPFDRVDSAMLWLIGGTLVGGRLGYALFYDRSLFVTWLDHAPWWGLLAINEGGMASHGGMVGLALAAWKVSGGFKDEQGRIIGRAPFLHTLDVVALVSPAGIFFGRIANFINGELLGEIVTKPGIEGPWWAVQFPQELDLKPGELQQTTEQWTKIDALAEVVAPGRPAVGLHKLAHEGWNYTAQLKPLISSRHPSQIYQAVAEGLVVGAIMWIVWARPRKPGIVAACFLIVYGFLRIATELIRLPDAQLEVKRILGLSRGQWLSVGMIVVGAWLIAYVVQRSGEKMGGWRARRAAQGQ
jgi:phosphatidylglycerol:prolipoprotein diacylglycerol transferase